MADNILQNQSEIYADFYKWLCMQPLWLQDATWRIYNNRSISDTQIEVFVEMCLKEIQKEKPTINVLNEDDIVPQKKETTICIKELYDVRGVNALSDSANLSFSPTGVTVVYGLNGAGKSGYMRIFKQVCNHPCAEPIQPNIFSKGTSIEPSCKFKVTDNNIDLDVFCRLSKNNEQTILKQCDAFDTKISTSYLINKNNVSYEPFVFTVLSQLSDIAGKIDSNIQTKMSMLKTSIPLLPDELSDCELLNWYKNFSYKTKIPEIFFDWSAENEQQLKELENLNNKEQLSQQLKFIELKLQNLNTVKTEFKKINSYYITECKEKLIDAYKEYKSLEKQLTLVEKAFYESATPEDQISLSVSDWKELWNIAKKYYEAVLQENSGKEFATPESLCPLCHQPLIGDTQKRFESVNAYINSELSVNLKNKETQINLIFDKLSDIAHGNNALKSLITTIFDENTVTEMCDSFYSFKKIKEKSSVDDKFELFNNLSVKDILLKIETKSTELNNDADRLRTLIDTEEQKKLMLQLQNLRAQKWVYSNLSDLQLTLDDLNKLNKLSEARKLVKTNRITAEANILANALITDSYIHRFSIELKQLAKNIKVKIQKGQSIKGRTPYQVVLETETDTKTKTVDILSEGEQRIVALAAFFADATGRNESTPIIIDDPISSLDVIYEQKATKRIAELAKNRQVIVFTHRISFLVGLIDECENLGVNCCQQYIRSSHKGKDVPDFENIYHGKIPKQLNGLINDLKENKKRTLIHKSILIVKIKLVNNSEFASSAQLKMCCYKGWLKDLIKE